MSYQEPNLFIQKVNDLKDMVNSLEKHPERKQLLASCRDHEEVVRLAKNWGYDIGRRWGEGIIS